MKSLGGLGVNRHLCHKTVIFCEPNSPQLRGSLAALGEVYSNVAYVTCAKQTNSELLAFIVSY